jgi:hypothetical protein
VGTTLATWGDVTVAHWLALGDDQPTTEADQ